MKLFKTICWKMCDQLHKYIATPRMIVGYKNQISHCYLPLVRISNTTAINSAKYLNIQDNVFIGHYCFIEASQGVFIGKGTQVCSHNVITTHSSHLAIRLYNDEYLEHNNHVGYMIGQVYIGEYSFIGSHCTIMPNVKLGKGTIVKAYSLVKGEYPDFAIIAGNPAVVIGDTRNLDKKYLEYLPKALQNKYHQEFGNL
jgi:acetyltransferase-like isoleucine patch superfamily enzyme